MAHSGRCVPVLAYLCMLLVSSQPLEAATYASQSTSEVCTPSAIETPKNAGEVSAIVKKAREAGQKVKVVGTRHASSDIICTTGIALDLVQMNKIEINTESMEVTMETGATQEQVLGRLGEEGFTVIHPFVKYAGEEKAICAIAVVG